MFFRGTRPVNAASAPFFAHGRQRIYWGGMRFVSLAVVILASCVAHQVADDAGASESGSSPTAACEAAGGACIAPGPQCLALISASLGCGATNAICCTVAGATSVTTGSADAAMATTSADGGAAASTSTCNPVCEMTCEGNPLCIQGCGC